MKTIQKILALATIVSVFMVTSFVGNTAVAIAAFGLEVRSTNTSNPLATTTAQCMTAGNATTTLPLYTGNTDQVDLNITFNASTSATLKWRYEESNNNIDWFADSNELVANATTTTVVRDFAEYSWLYASSTAGTSASTTAFKHVKVKDLATYFWRAVFYVPPGSAGACVYVQATIKSSNPI